MRLIDADALPRLMQIYEFNGKRIEKEVVLSKIIDTAPTVDAVPVVRCKECKHHQYCCRGSIPVDDNGFCSHGERRDDE